MSFDHQAASGELQQLENRIDARFQTVNARFIAVDGRFADTGQRVDTLDEQAQTIASRSETRFRSIDNRLDATRTQVDHVRLQLSTQLARSRRQMLLGRALSSFVTAVLCLATILVLSESPDAVRCRSWPRPAGRRVGRLAQPSPVLSVPITP